MRTFYTLALVATLLLSTIVPVWAQEYEAVITLNPLPSDVSAGDTIIFSGQLITSDGQYIIPGRTIYIKDDVSFGLDIIIGSIVTDDNGEYSGSWVAEFRDGGGAYDFYAVFEGEENISEARSLTYSVYVEGSNEESFQTLPDYLPTEIELDSLPSSVYAGESITFTGTLTSDGDPVQNALIKIMEDDPFLADQVLSSGYTDSGGTFSIPWQVSKDSIETDFDIYATFDSDDNFEYARSANQIVSVLRFSGSISLDPLPNEAQIGDVLIFTGSLELSQGSAEGAIVYIKDEDPFTRDDLLATAYVNEDGTFSANWFVTEVDADLQADIYAVFEGNDEYYRLTTCDPNPTMDIGGSCEFTIPLTTYYAAEPSPESAQTYSEDQFMQLFYSLDFSDKPRVAIVPSPDSYDTAYRYIGAAQEGILMWQSHLESSYDGDWDVKFDVVTDNELFFSSKPDVIMNLVTPEQESGCNWDFAGYAKISPYPVKPIQTVVCVESQGSARSAGDVSATAAHEFIHAAGLGHTWNVRGDLMCSAEMVEGSLVYTCPDMWLGRSKTPSELNIAAVAALYGEEGFVSPNSKVAFRDKFTMGAGLGLTQTIQDADNDGIPDEQDECVEEQETYNRFEDTDGCPDDLPSSSYLQNSDQEEEASEDNQEELEDNVVHVESSVSNGYIERYQVNTESQSLHIFVTSNEDGSLTITLPRYVIDSKALYGNGDEEFEVYIDGRPASFSETSTNSEERRLVIQVPEGSSEIEVFGTEVSAVQVVPEFTITILIFAIAISSIAILIRKQNYFSKLF